MVEADSEIRARAHKLCKDYLHGAWLKIQPCEMLFSRVSGGLSNLLYLCALPEGVVPVHEEPSRLLLRLYGKVNKERAMETLVTESVIFALLSESQRGPRLYGVFPGGRLEEYIQARPLLTRELADPGLSEHIAEKMAQIHLMEVPINKHPKWLWQTMHRWLREIEEVTNREDKSEQAEKLAAKVNQLNLSEELAWLKNFLSQVNSPVVFCHNDLQEGNILIKEASEDSLSADRLVIIDYEYCSYNHRGFDFANHFCEWVYDYTNQEPPYFFQKDDNAPTMQQQEHFMRSYLSALKKSRDYRHQKQDTLSSLLEETRVFTLASHFFWALWSVVNSSVSEITFDYWGYGESRFNAYYQHKDKLLAEYTTSAS